MRSGTARRGARARLLVQEGLALQASRASPPLQEEMADDSRQPAASHKESSQPAAPHKSGRPALPPAPATRPAARHLWLAVHLPALPIECLKLEKSFSNTSQNIELPKVIVSGEGAQCEVVAADAAALVLGIRPGHGLNAAYALAPQLGVLPRQPQREQLALERLARLATQFTPWVSLEPPDALLLEVRGSLRLLGGTRALLARWRRELAREGISASLALTPTPLSALWSARTAVPGAAVRAVSGWAGLASALAPLPLTVTRWPAAVLDRLAEAGARQVGEVLRLPREGLARRYGPVVAEQLEQALGHRPTPRARTTLPERFMEGVELEAEATAVPALLPAVDHLLAALEAFLRGRNAGVHGVVLQLRHRPSRLAAEAGSVPRLTTVSLGLAAPGAAARRLGALLRERLDRLELLSPVCALRLRSGVVVPLPPDTRALPGTEDSVEAGAAEVLLDRLRARLGEGAVHGLSLVPEHRPEAAWRRAAPKVVRGKASVAAGKVPSKAPDKSLSVAEPVAPPLAMQRPLWLLPAPQRLRLREGLPWHEGPLVSEQGPERIESGWWDGAEVQRDYYTVRRADGVRLWVYRERGEVEPGSWWLHGVFG
jgi:protein ImuB